jgi:hypothetical protein
MSIEALASAVSAYTHGSPVSLISDIAVKAPLILHDESRSYSANIHVRANRTDSTPLFLCTLLTQVRDAADVVHLQATVGGRSRTRREPQHRGVPREWHERPRVPGRTVYEHFFHGPSFRVIDSAQWQEGRMLCRLTPGLPPSHLASRTSYMSPRLIEFGLQTAGLLALASTGEMLIPDFIGSIERMSAVDVDADTLLFAVASVGSEPGSTDIEILDATGCAVMSISDYRTVPLPFPADKGGLAVLAQALRGDF